MTGSCDRGHSGPSAHHEPKRARQRHASLRTQDQQAQPDRRVSRSRVPLRMEGPRAPTHPLTRRHHQTPARLPAPVAHSALPARDCLGAGAVLRLAAGCHGNLARLRPLRLRAREAAARPLHARPGHAQPAEPERLGRQYDLAPQIAQEVAARVFSKAAPRTLAEEPGRQGWVIYYRPAIS